MGSALPEGYAPRIIWLESSKLGGFLYAIKREGFDYYDIIEGAGLKYIEDKLVNKLGQYEHWVDICWILQFLREYWGCKSYFEMVSKLGEETCNRHRPDVSMVIGDGDVSKGYSDKLMAFRKYLFEVQREIEFTEEMRENIYQINVDFLHSRDMKLMVEKALRRYQGEHKLVIIVLTGTSESGKGYREKLLKHDQVKDLKYKERIFVLNKEEFARLIGLRGGILTEGGESYYAKFKEGSELFQQAFSRPEKVENEAFLNEEFDVYFNEADGSTKGWLEYLRIIELLNEIVKDNPYPYETEEQSNEDNFIGDR